MEMFVHEDHKQSQVMIANAGNLDKAIEQEEIRQLRRMGFVTVSSLDSPCIVNQKTCFHCPLCMQDGTYML